MEPTLFGPPAPVPAATLDILIYAYTHARSAARLGVGLGCTSGRRATASCHLRCLAVRLWGLTCHPLRLSGLMAETRYASRYLCLLSLLRLALRPRVATTRDEREDADRRDRDRECIGELPPRCRREERCERPHPTEAPGAPKHVWSSARARGPKPTRRPRHESCRY